MPPPAFPNHVRSQALAGYGETVTSCRSTGSGASEGELGAVAFSKSRSLAGTGGLGETVTSCRIHWFGASEGELGARRLFQIAFARQRRWARRDPFQVYGLPINNLVVGQAQLGNEISGTDKILRWRDKSVSDILWMELPSVGANLNTG